MEAAMTAEIKTTPMMAQWEECKKEAGSALLLFRLGDFYEAFYDDALLLAQLLDITLTKRQEIPMAGIPWHTSEGYIDKLISKGLRVAIAEQVEDPSQAKGLVKRKVVRIATPGTAIQSSLLVDKKNHFISCIAKQNVVFGHALLDLSTGELHVMETEDKKCLQDELSRVQPKEILTSEKIEKEAADLWEGMSAAISTQEMWRFDPKIATEFLLKHFQVHTLDGFGLKEMTASLLAAGALLAYVQDDLHLPISHIDAIHKQQMASFLSLDRTVFHHLEIPKLIELLDVTLTPMGGRLLRTWISHPLLSPSEIQARQDAIEDLIKHPFSECLSGIRDLERLMIRITAGYGTPRDLVGLRYSLEQIPPLAAQLKIMKAPLLIAERTHLIDVAEITHLIRNALVDTPPLRLNEGGIIREGFHPELDEWRNLSKDSHAWIARYQTELRQMSGIKTLKVGYTAAFGYYIEVSRGQIGKVPTDFQRRQTLVNSERYITSALKEFEHKMLHAQEKIGALENLLFHQIREKIASYHHPIRKMAQAIAKIDVLHALAQIAKRHNYIRPLVDDADMLKIEGGRHPIIEASLRGETFIPNDTLLDDHQNRLILITGPNMAGKSTYIRQTALLVIMAQDRIFHSRGICAHRHCR